MKLSKVQTSLTQLIKSSELQTEILQNWREDLVFRSDDKEINGISGGNNITGRILSM